MKKFFAIVVLLAAFAVSACWETSDPVTGGYGSPLISTPDIAIRLDGQIATGGLTLALPAQLDIRITTASADQVTLQYRLGTSGTWITLKTITGTECATSTLFRPVFGRDTFTAALLGSSGTFQFRVHVAAGTYQNFPLSSDGSAYTINISDNRRPVWVE